MMLCVLLNNHSFMVVLYNINIEERCIVGNSVMLCQVLLNNHSFMVVLYNINIEERYIVQRANSVMLCGKSCSIIILLLLYNINIEERCQRPIV